MKGKRERGGEREREQNIRGINTRYEVLNRYEVLYLEVETEFPLWTAVRCAQPQNEQCSVCPRAKNMGI
jgi:hypothetical protein